MIVKTRQTKTIEEDIKQLEQDITFGKKEINSLYSKIGNARLNIDSLKSELSIERIRYEEAKQMVTDCKKQIEDDQANVDSLKIQLTIESGGEAEYIRPCNKPRHHSETKLSHTYSN